MRKGVISREMCIVLLFELGGLLVLAYALAVC